MNPHAALEHQPPGRFRIGDRLRVLYGFPGAVAEIIEDHGPLGVGGRRFYTVRLTREDMEDLVIDWPEDELLPLDGDTPTNGAFGPRADDAPAGARIENRP
jgi:hypothetical protein